MIQPSENSWSSIDLAPKRQSLTKPVTAKWREPLNLLRRIFRAWREHERQRSELSKMCPRDFGDLSVPPGLVRDELRRWPWQEHSLR
jgi:uncharacterized protein YjiS (DUF1127 family)